MGEDTTRLKQEIEATREDLTRDVDAVAFKASPQRIVGDRVEAAKGRMTGIKERVMGSAHETGSSAAQTLRETAGGTVDSAREMPGQVAGQVRGRAQGNPLAAGMIAFGAGWLISSLMPATEAETRLAEQGGQLTQDKGAPLVEQAKQEAKQIGQELGEQLRPAVQEAAESVKQTAAQGAQQVKEQGTSAARAVGDEARGHAEEVRAHAGSSSATRPAAAERSDVEQESLTPVYTETVDVTGTEVISPQTGRRTQ